MDDTSQTSAITKVTLASGDVCYEAKASKLFHGQETRWRYRFPTEEAARAAQEAWLAQPGIALVPRAVWLVREGTASLPSSNEDESVGSGRDDLEPSDRTRNTRTPVHRYPGFQRIDVADYDRSIAKAERARLRESLKKQE